MPRLLGYLDTLLRPRLGLRFDNGARLDVLVDTGFNGGLLLGEQTARRVGVSLLTGWRILTVAGGGPPIRVQEGEVDLVWLSSPPSRRASVFVHAPEPGRRRGEPDGLLGMLLIAPDKLLIDCLNGQVSIET